MAKTKKQKEKAVEEGIKDLAKSQTLIFADFTGTPTKEMNALREMLKGIGGKFEVFKKRLFRIAAEKNKIEFPVEKFEGQLGVVFTPDGLEEVAGPIYKFSKSNESFKIVGGIDLKEKKFLEADFIKMMGSLPSREVLLSQVAVILTVPIKKLLVVLSALKDKKVVLTI